MNSKLWLDKKSDAINQMNEFGKNKIPFFFIIDFEFLNPLVFKLDEVWASENSSPFRVRGKVNFQILKPPSIKNKEILFDINGFKNYEKKFSINKNIIFKKFPISIEQYEIAFNKIIENINYGNSYLLNLTQPTKIEINLCLKEIFLRSNARYKLLYKDEFVVFSPEIFIKISNNQISSFPMKGTIDASIPDAEKIILNDKKELAEHSTIVDLLRNDLSIVAKNVRVEKFRYVEKIKTNNKDLLQISSKITGQLSENFNDTLGSIIFSLLPAGSISGAPKKKTIEIIKETEKYERGYYTGIFGYFDGRNLDSGVMIRFIEKNNNTLFYKSGGGITAYSDMKSEYNELIDKVYVPVTGNN
ncbi:MAG: aminodeoxychorismate synthase component I [Bacteroidales bacterium]|jgi:para-aminobenzoate synthetase component 1